LQHRGAAERFGSGVGRQSQITRGALDKHVHPEKPLATNRQHGHRIIEAARSKGLTGLVNAVCAIRGASHPRASGDLAYHVLDVLRSILESNETGRHAMASNTVERPALLQLDADLVGTQ
jgi:predicted dehydrogenase